MTDEAGIMQWVWDLQLSIEETVIPDAALRAQYLPTWWPLVVVVYLIAEVAFFVYFKTVMVPYANTIIPPSEYRDYGRDRHKLILRILERVTRTAKVNGRDDLEETARYLLQWFEYAPQRNHHQHLASSTRKQKQQQQQQQPHHKHASPTKREVTFAAHCMDNSPCVSSPARSSSSSGSGSGSGSKPTLLVRLSDSSIGSSLGTSSICSMSGPDDSDADDLVSADNYDTADDAASDGGSMGDDDDDDEDDESNMMARDDSDSKNYTVTVLRKDDIDDFMAWGFFGKFVSDLVQWERDEMDKCYNVLEDMHGIRFQPGRSPNYKLRHLLSLEDCVAIHRPLAFYAQVTVVKWCASQLFRLAGFSRHVSQSGVICWYKPAADDKYSKNLLPLCFFHGVGPGGHALYTLMVLLGLNRTGRAIFLFENHSVSCSLNFKAISEQDIVSGVQEMVDRFCGDSSPVALMGHSFGSSALTWLLHSPMRSRIRQMVILEPVSIMLSEADVIMNMAKPIFKLAIDIVLEHYIRRQYPWYNSELWLEDIPEDVHVIIGLAGKDPIICTEKVTQEIEAFCAVNPKVAKNMDFIYWKNNLHGMCLGLPWCWKDINNAMLKQEQAMMQSKASRQRKVQQKVKSC